MIKNKKNIPEITEPTDEELEQTKKMMKDKYYIIIPKPELVKMVNLIKELDWWITHDKGPASPRRITEEMAIEFKELPKKVRGIDIPVSEAYDEARSLLVMTAYKEKERISKEMRAIMVTYTRIPYNQVVEEKTGKLFQLHYGVELTKDQLGQVVQYLTRNLWYEEGFQASLEKCIDDLLVYADKRKRGKRVNAIKLHDNLRKNIDEAMCRLNVPNVEWERLYQEKDNI